MTSSCNRNDPQDILRSFDYRIGEQNEAIVRLKRERNCHVPFFRLPAEILSEIFLYNVIDGNTEFAYQFFPSFLGGWISITHVCHFWREVAVNSASLWSCWGEPRLNLHWMELLLSRSRQAPLYIRMTVPPNPYNKTLVELLRKASCLGRTQELHIRGPWSSLFEILEVFSPIPASDNDSANDVPECPMQSIIIHPTTSMIPQLNKDFQSLKFPHLRRLILVDCTFDLESTIFDSAVLTHLTLGMRPGMIGAVTISRLLSILANKPRLEELILKECNVICASDSDIPFVDLPHLRSVELEGSASSCFTLMTKLSYPRARIKITLNVSSGNEEDLTSSFVPFLSKHYGYDGNRDGPPIIRQLHILDHFTLEIRCMPDLEPFNHSMQEPSLRLTIGISYLRETNAIMTAACTSLPLHDVRRLVYDGKNLDHTQWRSTFFDAMNDLEDLEVYGSCSGDAIFALNSAEERDSTGCDNDTSCKSCTNYGSVTDGSEVPDQSKTPGVIATPAEDIYGSADESEASKTEKAISATAILLPKLKTLRLTNADFHYLSLADELAYCLETRKHANCELDFLSVENCANIDSDDIERYEKYAKRIDWDEYVDFDSDTHDSENSSEEEDDEDVDNYQFNDFEDWGYEDYYMHGFFD